VQQSGALAVVALSERETREKITLRGYQKPVPKQREYTGRFVVIEDYLDDGQWKRRRVDFANWHCLRTADALPWRTPAASKQRIRVDSVKDG